MQEYTSFICRCKRTLILSTEELQASMRKGIYLKCPYCSSKKIIKILETDSVKECMREHRYKRGKHGAIMQID